MVRRLKNRSGKEILSKYLCVDDFGNEVFLCHWTRNPVFADDYIVLGPFNQAISGTYVCHPSALNVYAQSRIAWDESERNCNVCLHLVRIRSVDKYKTGLLSGACNVRPEPFLFHPGDPMHMPCWTHRKQGANID